MCQLQKMRAKTPHKPYFWPCFLTLPFVSGVPQRRAVFVLLRFFRAGAPNDVIIVIHGSDH